MKYRKLPVVVEAIQWKGDNLKEVIEMIGLNDSVKHLSWSEYEKLADENKKLKIFTLEGTMMASIGDWIIKGVNGEAYPCKPDIFEKTYEIDSKITVNTFSIALEALKKGKSVQRVGWNGNGLKVKAQFPDENSKMTLPYLYIEYPQDSKTTPGARCPWLASQTDLMAEDWVILD